MPGYSFLLTAVDGQISGGGAIDRVPDQDLVHCNNDVIVYDNQFGALDGDALTAPNTALGGVSVVIHN